MPVLGHPDDCACCVPRLSVSRTIGRKRTGEDADLSNFLPRTNADEDEPVEDPEELVEDPEELADDDVNLERIISNALFAKFEKHVSAIERARASRQEMLCFKSALEDEGNTGDVSADASLDERDGLGVWLPNDEMQGDVNMRTLQKLLTRVDQRGFERSSQQLEFHVAFLKAAARVIYRGDWETEKPAIMRKNEWETSNSEVLIRCAQRT